MKNTARILTLSAVACIAAQAAPFLAVGDNAELFVTATGGVKFDNNIFLDPDGLRKDDTIFNFTPGLDLTFGKGSNTTGNVFYREEFRRYSDNTSQNGEFSRLGTNVAYDNGITSLTFKAGYAQLAQNDRDNNPNATGILVRRDLSDVAAGAEFGVSQKTSFAVGAKFVRNDFRTVGFVDRDEWDLPLDLYYKATAKMDWSVGYRYRSTKIDGNGLNSDDNFFNIGARGDFSPKLRGQLRVGYTKRSFDNGNDRDLFGVDSSLTYFATEKSSLQLNFSNDFGASSFGGSTKTTTIGLNSTTRLNEQWLVDLGVNYNATKYLGGIRKDDYLDGYAGVRYIYNQQVNFGAQVLLRKNDSNLAPAEFKNSVVSFTANIRY